MKKIYMPLVVVATLAGCGSIATEQYTNTSLLTEEERMTFDCEGLAKEEDNLVTLLNNMGEVKTSDQVVSNLGIATAILRASLGGFNTQDLSYQANVKEKAETVESTRLRLNEIKELRSSKKAWVLMGRTVMALLVNLPSF